MTTLFDTRDPGPLPPRRKAPPAPRHVLRRDDGWYAVMTRDEVPTMAEVEAHHV